jgi:hypothetical protein
MASPTKRRAVLTPQLAREIFRLRYAKLAPNSHAASTALASKYQVSSKTIRDIWSGRCWLEATSDLWDDTDRPQAKVKGRPKGRKDSKPRRAKTKREIPCVETEYSFDGLRSHDAKMTQRKVSIHSHATGHPSIYTSNNAHQMQWAGEKALDGLKSMVPGSSITQAPHISSFAQPRIVDSLSKLAFQESDFRVSGRAHPSQTRQSQPLSDFHSADFWMRAGMLPLPVTTSAPCVILPSVPAWFSHIGAEVGQHGLSGVHMPPVWPWLPGLQTDPIMMPSFPPSARGCC